MKCIHDFLQETRDMVKKDSVKAIIYNDDKILILRRQNDQPGGGQWDLAGGCIEKNESQIDALKREVYEETNIPQISDIKRITTKKLKLPEHGIDSEMTFYKCSTDYTDIKMKPANWEGSDGKPEHTEFRWISCKEDIENLPMLDILKTILMNEF